MRTEIFVNITYRNKIRIKIGFCRVNGKRGVIVREKEKGEEGDQEKEREEVFLWWAHHLSSTVMPQGREKTLWDLGEECKIKRLLGLCLQ